LSLFGAFKKQWGVFSSKFEVLGKRIEDIQKEYTVLASTRRRRLEKPLSEIDGLRREMGITITADISEK